MIFAKWALSLTGTNTILDEFFQTLIEGHRKLQVPCDSLAYTIVIFNDSTSTLLHRRWLFSYSRNIQVIKLILKLEAMAFWLAVHLRGSTIATISL